MSALRALARRLTQRVGSTTRTVVLLVLLVTAGFATTAYFAVERTTDRLIDQVDERLIDDTRAVSLGLNGDQAKFDVGEIGQALGGRQALVVIAATGEILASSPSGDVDRPDPLPPLPLPDVLAGRLGRPFDAGGGPEPEYRVIVSALPDGEFLMVATPLAPFHQILEDLAASLKVVGAVVLGILGLFIWAVIRSANRQIDKIIDVAARIGSGDLSARIGDASGATEAARLAHALNAMTAQLEDASAARAESDERLRRFVADASHELRTPLATIRGYAQLHRAGALTDPAESARAMNRIESETGRMGQLVEEMLLLARLDQGRPLKLDQVDLGPLVTDAVADARARDPDRRIDLLHPAEPMIVSGDEVRLQQAMDNLLANTRAHTPAQTSVRVEVTAEGDTVKIVVADDGPGMEPSQAAKAFDRFYRAEPSRTRGTGGTGLGLAIVASIVDAHQGRIALHTQPGKGATFTIWLPHANPQAATCEGATLSADQPLDGTD